MFKSDVLATAGYHCLSNLITNVLTVTECNLVCSQEQENPYVFIGFDYKLNMLSPDYVFRSW